MGGSPHGAQDEFLLAASAQNLCKLAKLRPEPPPTLHPAAQLTPSPNRRAHARTKEVHFYQTRTPENAPSSDQINTICHEPISQ
jgi:hypothetical protein